jgi:RNA polymerase sigma-70 factor, ECF subfamily
MTESKTSLNRDRLFFRFHEMRPLLLALANEKICREIQAKVGASDLVQLTMLEAFQHVDAFEPEDDRHLFNWLSKILINNLKDVTRSFLMAQKRSVNRERHLSSDSHFADSKVSTQHLELEEDLESLRKAWTCLSNAHQQVLTWRFHDQLSFPEIAELVGRSEDAVRMLTKRALGRLAREMNR